MVNFDWKLMAKVAATYTDQSGNVYPDVIEEVTWYCTATDGATSVESMGAVELPKPETGDGYIDLSEITSAEADYRRGLILGWAEAVVPGFKQQVEDVLAVALARKSASEVRSVEII